MSPTDGLVRPWGERLRWWREANNMSRGEFCRRLKLEANSDPEGRYVNPDEKLIYRWEAEKYKRGPQAVYRRALARIGAPLPDSSGRELARDMTSDCPSGTVAAPSCVKDDGDVDRRTFLRGAALTAAGTALGGAGLADEPWERLQLALSGRNQFDEDAMLRLESSTADLFDAEERMSASEIVGAAGAQLDRICSVLGNANRSIFQQRLTAQAGTAAAIAGWLSYDQGNFHAAKNYYDVAERAAQEAADYSLIACVRTYRSYLASAQGQNLDSLKHMKMALDTLPLGVEPTMKAWLLARQAEEFTALGSSMDALRSFDRSYVAMEFSRQDECPMWARFFTPTRLDSMAVASYARIGHESDMDIVAERLLSTIDERRTKVESIALADLAYAYLERGDVERGAELGQRSLDSIVESNSRVGHERLAVIDRSLAPYRDARIASGLRDRLALAIRAV